MSQEKIGVPMPEKLVKQEIEEGEKEYELTKPEVLQKLLENPEKNVDELIDLLTDTYESPMDEPNFSDDIENEKQAELSTVLRNIYKKMPLAFCYFLDDLKAYKAGEIKNIPRRSIPEYSVLQMDISSKHVYEDKRTSEEILDHICNLMWYVDRDIEQDSDMYYHEGHSQQFRFMVSEIAKRIKEGNLQMTDEEVEKMNIQKFFLKKWAFQNSV